MNHPKILALAGSTRQDSFNFRLLQLAATGASRAGADVSIVNLRDYPLPIFDEDLERISGTPQNVSRLQQLFLEHHGLLIASPEYNGSLSPLLKNTIDWVSRPIPNHPPLAAYQGKVAGLLSASSGGLGGLRGLVHVRAILGNIGVIVLPQQFALGKAGEAFDLQGNLLDPQQQQAAVGIGDQVARTLCKLIS
jgi:chromate reductase